MSNSKIRIDQIDDDMSDRLRPIDADHVAVIAASIAQQGLLQPIRVRPVDGGGYKLVLGAHRLAALKLLKREELTVGDEVLIAEAGDYSAKVDEIDENLARHELNALDRAIFLAKRKEFYLLANPDAKRGGDRKGKVQTLHFDMPRGFSAQAAKKLGLSRRAIYLSIQINDKLDPEAAKLLRGTKIERNQRELLAIAELADPEQQRAVAGRIHEGKAKTSQQAKYDLGFSRIPDKSDPQQLFLRDLERGWAGASAVTRETFMATHDLVFKPTAPAKGAKK
jgi:ParB family chromosome partitioning protein